MRRWEWTVFLETDRPLTEENLQDVELQLKLAVAMPASSGDVMSRRAWISE